MINTSDRCRLGRLARCRGAVLVIAFVCVALGCFSLGIMAAPIQPPKGELPDPVKSLADLRSVFVRVEPVPDTLESAGVTQEFIKRELKKQLKDAGIEVADNPSGVPTIGFSAVSVTDPDNVSAFVFFVEFVQFAHMHRLRRDLFVPTFFFYMMGVSDNESMPESARETVGNTMRGLMRNIEIAKTWR